MNWCSQGDSLNSTIKDGPSLCLVETFLLSGVNIFFVVVFVIRVAFIIDLYSFESLASRTKKLLFAFEFMILLAWIVGISVAALLNESASTLLCLVSEGFTWPTLAMLVYLEAWKIQKWPSILVIIFVSITLAFHALYASIIYNDSRKNSSVQLLAIAETIIIFIILCIALLKDLFRNEEDIAKEELMRYSVEFTYNHPVRRSTSSIWNRMQETVLALTGKNPERSISGASTVKASSLFLSHSEKSWMWPFGVSNASDVSFQSLLDEDLDNEEEVGSIRSGGSRVMDRDSLIRQTEPIDFGVPAKVESAIDRNRGTSFKTSSSSTSFFSSKPKEKVQTMLPSINGEIQPDLAINLGGSTSGKLSRAVSQILDQHRAKVSATGPLLEPRGHESSGFDAPSLRREESGSSVSEKNKAILFRVHIQRWGIRSSSKGGSTHIESVDEETRRSASLKGITIETEFELITSSTTNSPQRNKGAISSAPNSQSPRWAVWHTSAEILRLHTTMMSQLGDFVPRRPHLKSDAAKAKVDPSHAELISDMRAIALYLNALLKVDYNNAKHIPTVLEFLRVPKDSYEVSLRETEMLALLSAPDRDTLLGSCDDTDGSVSQTAAGEADETAKAMGAADNSRSVFNQSLMDAAEQSRSHLENQQEKWRKLFFHMRVKLKPRDIAIRCRLFEGVVSGGDVAAWLLRSTGNIAKGTTDPDFLANSQPYEHARDRFEACAIGQELLNCELLLPICLGFLGEDDFTRDEHEDDGYETSWPSGVSPDRSPDRPTKASASTTGQAAAPPAAFPMIPQSSQQQQQQQQQASGAAVKAETKFSDMPGYVYRFPIKSGTAGTWTLFGAKIVAKIPLMTLGEDNENNKPTRETVGFAIFDSGLITEAPLDSEAAMPSAAGGGSVVKYLIDILHGGDSWQTTRRYREFEQLNRALGREGIRPEVPLPSKSLVTAITGVKLDESRRAGLEQYLISAIQAVIDGDSKAASTCLAQFLDPDFDNLRMLN